MNLLDLLIQALEAGADAADYRDPCPTCSAKAGRPCVLMSDGRRKKGAHDARLSGDETLAFVLRTMARTLRTGRS